MLLPWLKALQPYVPEDCCPGRFVPVYNSATEDVEHPVGGEHGVADNRHEMAEMGLTDDRASAGVASSHPSYAPAGQVQQ